MSLLRIYVGHHFFGAGNLGDDLMMGGFLRHLEGLGGSVEIACSIAFPLASQQTRFPQVRWLSYGLEQREEAIRQCDVWLGLGDTPFQMEVGSWFLDHLAEEVRLCRKHGKPMHFLGVGVGDMPALRQPQTRTVLDYAARVWTRDARSAELLADLCGSAKVAAGADLAHLWLRRQRFAPIEPEAVGYVMNFENRDLFSPAVMPEVLALAPTREHRWLAQEVRDFAGSERANYSLLDERTRAKLKLCLPDYGASSVQELFRCWGTPAIMVSSRYHGATAAAWMGCRLVLVERNEKLRGLGLQLAIPGLGRFRDAAEIARAMDQSRPVDRRVLEGLADLSAACCDQFLQSCGASQLRPQ